MRLRIFLCAGPIDLDRMNPAHFEKGGILKGFHTEGGRPILVTPRVIAVKLGMIDSEERGGRYSLLEVVQTPSTQPEGGLFCEFTDIWMSCPTPGAGQFYFWARCMHAWMHGQAHTDTGACAHARAMNIDLS